MSRKAKTSPPPISIRVTWEERTKIEKDALGTSLSQYVRERLLGDKAQKRKTRGKEPVKDHTALARLLGLLGKSRIADNLNQLARDANCGAIVMDDATREQITEAYAHVQSMRAELIRALGLFEAGDREE